MPTEALPDGLMLPEAGEDAAKRRWRDFRRDKIDAYDRHRDRPDLDATSHMSVHLKWGEIHPRTMLADLRAARARARRRSARSWPGASSTPTCCSTGPRPRATTSARSSSRWPTTSPASSSRRGARAHRLPDRRRGHAPAAGHRLDAQPRPDDRGELPGQGPPRGVAARRPPLPALAGRRRPGIQPARVAVDGGLRHRRRAVLPGVQPGHPGPQVRSRRRLRQDVGARAARRRRPPRAASDPIVDHAEERREALDRYERIRK